MSEKKSRKLTSKQAKLVEGIIAGKSGAQAARDAGYSENHPENAGQSGYQAIKQLGDRVRNVMDEAGFTLEHLIDKDLRLVLEAKETKFFPFRKTVKTGGKTPGERIVQVIDRICQETGLSKGTAQRALHCSIRAVPSMLSPGPERFERPAHSNTSASVHHPNVHAEHKARPHPNGIPSSHSILALAGPVSLLRFERVPRPQDVSGPKIAALDDQQYVPMCSRLAFASR